LNPAGSALVYSTYLGGNDFESARSIAVDNAGNVYLTGDTDSTNFPVVNALHPALRGLADAFVAKLNSAGSALVYSTYLGGDILDFGSSIAIDSAGNAYVTGSTTSHNFPTTNPIQANRSGHPLFRSTNSAGNWAPGDSGMSASEVTDLVFQPGNSSIVYAAADTGLFKSTDGGATWNAFPTTPKLTINKLAIDSTNTTVIYAAATGGMFKSTDGGNNFTAINNGFAGNGDRILIDPVTPTTLYGTNLSNTVFRSVDAGASWTSTSIADVTRINELVVDPNTPATLYAATNKGVSKSTNSGASWTTSDLGLGFSVFVNDITIDKTNNAVYAATDIGLVKTMNGGSTWTNLSESLNKGTFAFTDNVAIDPTNSSVLYIFTSIGLQKTINGGAIWTTADTGFPHSQFTFINALVINPTNPSILFIATSSEEDAFVTKLSAGGTSQIYSTYLGGSAMEQGAGIAVDPSGNAYVAGLTSSNDFPVANALQRAKADVNDVDAFITKLNPSGSALVYSTFLGGDSSDFARAIAVDASGNAYVAGTTSSRSFPTVNAYQVNLFNLSDAFVAKLNATGSELDYSTFLGGDRIDDCFGIAVDAEGSAYVTGNTNSTNFHTLAPSQPFRSDFSTDVFLTRLSADGSSLRHSAYFGGASNDSGRGIAVDASHNIYIVGSTASSDLPTMNPLQPTTGGGTDAFVAKLRPTADVEVFMFSFPFLGVSIGSTLTYTIAVTNVGGIPATGVMLTDTLPAGVTLVSANSTIGSCSGTNTINCNIGTLNPEATAIVVIVVTPTAASTITNTATATINEADVFLANNTSTSQTRVIAVADVTGRVKDNFGNPIAGLRMGAVGGFPTAVTSTDANGFYSFPKLEANLSYTISPDQFTAYDFVPANQTIQNLTTSVVMGDFVGTKQPANVISGRVIEAGTGQAVPGVRVDLNLRPFTIDTRFTDANGNFSFGERKRDKLYDVFIFDNLDFIFEPKPSPSLQFAQIQIPSLTSDQNLTFTAVRANTVQFTATTAAVDERSGSLEIVVTRSGNVGGAATVNFATADTAGLQACSVVNGKASERCDYGSTAGTLRFGAGETSKSIVIPIVNDVNVEGNETFTIALTDPVGAQLGFSFTTNVTVRIADDDTTSATQNPIDGVEPFVTQQYIDFLGRIPDSVGFANWVTTLSGCPQGGFGENLNPSCDRVHVSAGFFLSDEFRGRGYFAYRFYEVAFDRRPRYAEFVPDMAQVGGAQSPQSELLSKAAYTDAFVQRSEFTNRYNGLSNSAYVNALEQNAEITLSNKADLIAALDGNQKTRAQVLREIVESKAAEDKFFIRAFVAMQYFGYLRRDPDTIGYDNWVTTLTNDPSNFRHMIFGFLFSNEYRGRFGP